MAVGSSSGCGIRGQEVVMRSLNALATMVAVLLVGALVSGPAFAYRGGGSGRGGGGAGAGGGQFVGPGALVIAGGGQFVRPGGVVVAGGGGKVFVGSRVVVGVGVGFPVYWGPRWYYPHPAAYPYYAPYSYPYYYPPDAYPSRPTTYIEQGSGQAAPQQPAPEHWWYYCAESKMYYPYAKECPGGWQRVSPQPPPPN